MRMIRTMIIEDYDDDSDYGEDDDSDDDVC
jgi:hypothetical protein